MVTNSNRERELGTARVLIDKFKINNREVELAVVKGLTETGYDVEIAPEFTPGAGAVPPVESSTITVYRKVDA